MSIAGDTTGSGSAGVAEATAVAAAWAAGDLMVGGVGNDGAQVVLYPAGYSQVIAVSGTDPNDVLHADSNYGSHVEIAAPFQVLTLHQASGVQGDEGTSFAPPAVSGAAALLWLLHPGWTNLQVRNRLRTTAEDLGAYGVDDQFGWGLLDAKASVAVDVSIAGPSMVQSGDYCTSQVVVEGAAGTVSQQWSGVLSGTGSFVSGSLFNSGTLLVDVQTSGGQSGSANVFITVSSSAPTCTI